MLWLNTSGREAMTVWSASSSTPRKSGCQHFDRGIGQLALERPDGRCVVARATIRHVVAVDRRDDHVLQLHLGRDVREAQGLSGSGGLSGLPLCT